MGNFTGFQQSQDYYQHPKLGLIKRIQKQNGPQFIQQHIIIQSQQIFQQWKTYLHTLELSGLTEVLFIPHNYYFQKVGYCGRNGEVFLLFDDFMFSLKDQIQNRHKIQRLFPQPTVIEILYRLAKAETDLQKLNLRIGHVKSQNIMVNQDGDWRIISQHSCPLSLFPTIQQQEQLLSPEELQKKKKADDLTIKKSFMINSQANRNSPQIQKESNISQIFSIGMMILEICTLEPSSQVYQNGFNSGLLEQRIKAVEGKYSFPFVNILKGMLELVPNKRIKSTDIVKILSPYEKSILAHQEISFQFSPNTEVNNITKVQMNNSTKTTSDSLQKQNKNSNKWQRLINFFPFLNQQVKNNEQMNHRTIHKSSSCFGQRRTITVGGSH